MRRSNYDKFPVTNITGEIWVGIEDIISQLQREIVKKDFIFKSYLQTHLSTKKIYHQMILHIFLKKYKKIFSSFFIG